MCTSLSVSLLSVQLFVAVVVVVSRFGLSIFLPPVLSLCLSLFLEISFMPVLSPFLTEL